MASNISSVRQSPLASRQNSTTVQEKVVVPKLKLKPMEVSNKADLDEVKDEDYLSIVENKIDRKEVRAMFDIKVNKDDFAD